MTPRVGPMHGVQPRPKRKPSNGAAASPTAGTLWIRTSRWNSGNSPMKTSPSTTANTPSAMVKMREYSKNQRLTPADITPRPTKTTEKPSTKSDEPTSIRPRRGAASESARSAPESPVVYDR